MGMSIEEAIEGLHDIQKCYNDDPDAIFLGFDDKDNESMDFAIATMRKYQKIQEIVSSKTTRLSYEDGFRQIKEVLEDEIN